MGAATSVPSVQQLALTDKCQDVASATRSVQLQARLLASLLLRPSSIAGLLLAFGVAAIAFALHQLFIWSSADPRSSFERARKGVVAIEYVYDAVAYSSNVMTDMVYVVQPAFNALSNYVVEPTVYMVLDVIFIVIAGESYPGLISEEEVPFKGLTCPEEDAPSSTEDERRAALWCGQWRAYSDVLSDSKVGGETISLDTASARRLSEQVDYAFPVLPHALIDTLVDAARTLIALGISLLAPITDMGFHVLYIIIEETLPLIVKAMWTILSTVIEIVLMVVRSGLLEVIMGMALDIILILVVDVAVPLLFAAIDMLMCVLDLFGTSTWHEQSYCIAQKCFGPDDDAAADLIVFTSAPIIIDVFYNVVQAAVNSKTARSYTGKTINLGTNRFSPSQIPALSAGGCASCFVCKVRFAHPTFASLRSSSHLGLT